MDTLGRLFGNKDIVRILRLFIFNPTEAFELSDVAQRTNATPDSVRTEMAMLRGIGFVKPRSFYKEVAHRRGSRTSTVRRRTSGYALNPDFPYLEGLRQLLAQSSAVNHRELLKKLGRAGRLKLVVLTGVFMHDLESKLDLLLVGDRLRRKALESSIRDLETELGKEIRYAAFATDDFLYRLSMHDRLVRDALDYKHHTVVDRLGVEMTYQ